MCGLIAAQLAVPTLNEQTLATALRSISHRGPDGTGAWFSPDRRTVLGHVRLSIIGVENGAQPMWNARGDIGLVCNGEFYGYQSIREKLRREGFKFATDSDSEVALHLYDRFGTGFTKHLRGEFAIVIADQRSGELIAVRDRFGIKPLYYAVHQGSVFFASEIKALLALGVPARWDRGSVLRSLYGLRTDCSLFSGIYQVPPGSIMRVRNGAVHVESYWDVVYPTAEQLSKDTRSEPEVIEGFRHVLEDAVAERLIADVEVACYLSGGLDSSAVLGLAQRRSSRPIRAFTISFEGAFDEAPQAERTAAFTGSTFIPVVLRPHDFADAFSDAVWHAERNLVNANSIGKFLLSRAVRDAGIKVVFTGEGSDEMLAGYPPERLDNILHGSAFRDDAQRQAALDSMFAANPLMKSLWFADSRKGPGVETMAQALGHCPAWMRASMIGDQIFDLLQPDLVPVDPVWPYQQLLSELDIPGRLLGRDPVNIGLYLWQRTNLLNIILTILADRMEMAHSVEGRVPFLDHHVAEFAAGLPVHYKIRHLTEKYVLREAARDVLTDELYRREKHPFIAPPLSGSNTRDALRDMCEDVLRSRAFEDQPLFDPLRVRAWLDNGRGGPAFSSSAMLMIISSFALMHQRFGMGNTLS